MKMIAHDHVRPYLEAFEIPTIFKTIDDDVLVNFPGKYIHPIYYSKCKEIGTGRIVHFATGGHEVNI
jgi:hypothetical protein